MCRLPREPGTCTNSVYQALFPPPPHKSLGTRLVRATQWQLTIKDPISWLKKGRPRCYAKSQQDMFWSIPGLISFAGVTRRWGLPPHAQNEVWTFSTALQSATISWDTLLESLSLLAAVSYLLSCWFVHLKFLRTVHNFYPVLTNVWTYFLPTKTTITLHHFLSNSLDEQWQ